MSEDYGISNDGGFHLAHMVQAQRGFSDLEFEIFLATGRKPDLSQPPPEELERIDGDTQVMPLEDAAAWLSGGALTASSFFDFDPSHSVSPLYEVMRPKVEAFRFDKNQPRDEDGKWTDGFPGVNLPDVTSKPSGVKTGGSAKSTKKVTPAVIYKKHDDGAVVGHSASGQRMRWDAGRKKFVVEKEKNDSWVEESAHTKTSAYNEFKNPDKWFEPDETGTENEPSSPSLTPEPAPADTELPEEKAPEAPAIPEPEKVTSEETSPDGYPAPTPVPEVDPDWPFSYEPFQEPQMDYGHLVRSNDDAYANDPNHNYELKTLPVNTIVPSQENDYEEWGDGLDNDMTGKPLAIQKDGNLYLMDGHHRTAKAGENGSIEAWVLDLDKPKAPQADTDTTADSDKISLSKVNDAMKRVADEFGVEIPSAKLTDAPGPPASMDHHTGDVSVNPAEIGRLEKYRDNKVSLGGALGWDDDIDVWTETGVHEGSHVLANKYLTNEEQVAALRAGAEAAGLPLPKDDENMASSYGWATELEQNTLKNYEPGTGAISKNLSRYGSFSSHETFAEAMAEYVLSDNPRPFAKGVGDHVKSILKKSDEPVKADEAVPVPDEPSPAVSPPQTEAPEIPQQADAPEIESTPATPYVGPTATNYEGASKVVTDTLRQAYAAEIAHERRVDARAAELRDTDKETYTGWEAINKSTAVARAELAGDAPPDHELTDALEMLNSALPEYKSYDKVQRRLNYEASLEVSFSAFAKEHGLGELTPEVKADLAKRTKDAFAGKKVAVRVSSKTVEHILGAGRIKSQFETNKSSGKKDIDMRASVETTLFGIDDSPWQNAEKRPIYGYVALDGIRPAGIGSAELGDPSTDQLTQYGNVQVVLKDSVRSRTTAMFGDSLNEMREGTPSPIDDPDYKSFTAGRGVMTSKSLDGLDRSGETSAFRAGSYAEAQIHGGVSADDIEEIVFPTTPNAALKKQLEDAGISYRVLNFKTAADGSDEERANALRIAEQDKPFIEGEIVKLQKKLADPTYAGDEFYKKDLAKYEKQLKAIDDALPALRGEKKSAKTKIAAAKEKVAKATVPKQAEAPKIESTPTEGMKMFSVPSSVSKSIQKEYIDLVQQQDFFGNLPDDKRQQKDNLIKQITSAIDDKDEATRAIESLEQLGRIEKTYDEFRARHNITTPVEEHKAELATKVKDAFADKDVAIRVTHESLERILDDGRFRSQFESGLATGTQDMHGKARREASWFGTSPHAQDDKDKRAIYGYVAMNGIVPADSHGTTWKDGPDKLSMFGTAQVVLKKDVRSRTAAMYGDSAVNWSEGRLSPIDNPSWESFTGIGDPKSFTREKALRDLDRDHASFEFRSTAYAEAAITGGVTTDDIAEVVFAKKPTPELEAQLAAKGIPWRVLTVATAAKVANPHERDGIRRMLKANVQHYENAIKAAESERDEHAAKGWDTKEDEVAIKQFNAQLTKAKNSLDKFDSNAKVSVAKEKVTKATAPEVPKQAEAPKIESTPTGTKLSADEETELTSLQADIAKLFGDSGYWRTVEAEITHKSGTGKVLTPNDIKQSELAYKKLKELADAATPLAERELELRMKRDGDVFGGIEDANAERWAAKKTPSSVMLPGNDPAKIDKIADSYRVNDKKTTEHNASIRSGDPSQAAKGWRSRMKRMINSQQLTGDAIVYRGAALRPERIMELRPGSVMIDPGSMSTDESKGSAEFYMRVRLGDLPGTLPTLFEIRAPKGIPVADVDYGEYVFDFDTPMRIISTKRENGVVHVVAELVPPAEAKALYGNTAKTSAPKSNVPVVNLNTGKKGTISANEAQRHQEDFAKIGLQPDSSPQEIFDKAKKSAYYNGRSILQILEAIDTVKPGYKKTVSDWVKTPEGSAYARGEKTPAS